MQLLKLALVLLVGLLAVKQTEAGLLSSPHRYFDEIDSYLMQHVGSDNAEENMAKAAEWLANSEKKSSSLVKALEKFLKLKSVVSEGMCNRDGYEILATNDKKANYPVRDASKRLLRRRIDEVVLHYAHEHSAKCTDVWPKLLANKMNELTPESRKRVLYLAEQKTIPWNHDFSRENFIKLIRDQLATDPEHQEKAATKRYNYEKNEVTMGDFLDYFVNPCKELKKVVMDDLFEPIRFDISYLGRDSEFAGDDKYKDFQLARSAMNYCAHILAYKGLIWPSMWMAQRVEKSNELNAVKEAAKQ